MPTDRKEGDSDNGKQIGGTGSPANGSTEPRGRSDAWRGEWSSNSQPASEPFAQVPDAFLRELTPDQWKAQQQIYVQAYERARAQVAASNHQFWEDHMMSFGDGI